MSESREHSQVFENDMVLPDQFFGTGGQGGARVPERTLMLAVLRDAVECYQKYARARDADCRSDFKEARRWIASTDREWLFSCENICEAVGIDPSHLRASLLKPTPLMRSARRKSPRIVSLEKRRVDPGSLGAMNGEIGEAGAA